MIERENKKNNSLPLEHTGPSPSYSLYSPTAWTVYLGKILLSRSSPLEEVARVLRIHIHQYYDDESHDYDLALLKLDRPASMQLAGHARPACLPPPTHQLDPGLLCWVTGWGALREGGRSSNVLQKVDVHLVSEEACVRSYGYLVTPRMLCAGYRDGGKDACQPLDSQTFPRGVREQNRSG
uniref:Peptidase S1 domain-containing protein n=1 Tax=Echeneis naucrates TaxID=173247 RepID=A0A665T3S9_ECHNA